MASFLARNEFLASAVAGNSSFDTRNMGNAVDRGPLILGTICAVTALSTFFTAGRLFVRGKLQGRFLLDDYLIFISVLCTWLTVVFQFMAVRSGNGRHVDTLTPEQRNGVAYWTIVGFVPGIISFATPKLATIDLLCRILLPSRWHRIFLWLLGWVCWIQLMITIIFLFVKCDGAHPARADAASSSPDSGNELSCLDIWLIIYFDIYTGAFSAFVDLYLAIYPTIVLCKLRLSLAKKIGLSIALGFGFVSCIIAIYKCTQIPSLASPDFSYDSSTLVIWTCVEGSTIIIAACIPVLKPLFDYIKTGCRQVTASIREGFSSNNRGASAGGGATPAKTTEGCRSPGENQEQSLFPLSTRTGIAAGPVKGCIARLSGAKLSKSGNFSRPRPRRGPIRDADNIFVYCSSSQDSILPADYSSMSEDAETDLEKLKEHKQTGHGLTQQQSRHGGIMKTHSIKISFKPAGRDQCPSADAQDQAKL